jgi:hypothetical protein
MDPLTISALISAAASLGSAGIDAYSRSGSGNSQLNTLRPNQVGLQDSLVDRIQSLLNGQGGLSPISQNAINRFNTQTVPSLAERFTSLGSGGSQGSSAFAGQLGQAGSDLQQQLQGLDFQQILQLLGPALGQSSENIQQEPSNFFSNAFGNVDQKAILDLVKAYQSGSSGSSSPATATGSTGLNALNKNFGSDLYKQKAGNIIPGMASLNRLGGNPYSFGV